MKTLANIFDEMGTVDDFFSRVIEEMMSPPTHTVRNIVDVLVGGGISNVIFNDPATIVFWEDGTKTVVKANNEKFDKEKGLAMCICKKACGNKGNFNEVFKKWCYGEENEK